MRILVIDDNSSKASAVKRVLTESGIELGSIDVADDAATARAMIRRTSYSLVILDLLLPRRVGDQPEVKEAINLLNDVSIGPGFKKPQRIVGFSEFEDAITAAGRSFEENIWTIIEYDQTSDSWERQLKNLGFYLVGLETANTQANVRAVVCWLTALDLEAAEVVKLPWNWSEPEPLDEQTFIRRGQFTSNDVNVDVVLTRIQRMGSVAAAISCSKLISAFTPKIVVMSGICAGVEGKVELGDLVCFDPVWEWPSGKLSQSATGSVFEPSPHQLACEEALVERAKLLASDTGVWNGIHSAWQGVRPKTNLPPRLHVAPGASGSAVVASRETMREIIGQHRKLAAVEMEVYGLFAAARCAPEPRPKAIALKSVSDFADSDKSDDFQMYASYVSAQGLAEYLQRYFHEL